MTFKQYLWLEHVHVRSFSLERMTFSASEDNNLIETRFYSNVVVFKPQQAHL